MAAISGPARREARTQSLLRRPRWRAGVEAFRWTGGGGGGGMRRLWDLLRSQGVDPGPDGWSRLQFAKATSADRNTIVGDGTRNGHQEAFVAVVPGPSAMAILAASGALAVRRRRHGRSAGATG
jgi:hypothetical protein